MKLRFRLNRSPLPVIPQVGDLLEVTSRSLHEEGTWRVYGRRIHVFPDSINGALYITMVELDLER